MKTLWLLTATLVIVGVLNSSAAQEPPPYKDWLPELSSEGAQLVIKEIERHKVEGVTVMRWHFAALGLPKDQIYKLWLWELGRDPEFGFTTRITESGDLVYQSDGNSPANGEPIEVLAYGVPAEPKTFALISKDARFRVFGKTVPFPIGVRDRECNVSVIMLAPLYDLVSLRVEGLKPNESFHVRMQSYREVGVLKPKADQAGVWTAVVAPYVKGKKQGFTTVQVTAEGCKLKTEFPWGVHFYQ